MDFAVPVDHRVRIKNEMIDKYLDLAREQEKTVKHDGDGDTNYSWNNPHRLERKTGAIGKQRKNRDYKDLSITEIGENTEKSPGDMRRLIVTQTLVKVHLLTMV